MNNTVWVLSILLWFCTCIIVSRKYAPPFATLALVQNAGGTYTQDVTISHAITPSLPIKDDSIVYRWGVEAKREAKRCSRRSWWASVLRGEKAGRFCEVAGVSIIDAGGLCSWYRQLSDLNKSQYFDLCVRGGIFAGHYGLPYYNTQNSYLAFYKQKCG